MKMTADQRRTLKAATERLLPSSVESGGAAEARVMSFVDWALGERLFEEHFVRAEEALNLLNDLAFSHFGRAFADCDETEQDGAMRSLHAFPHAIPRLRFESLLYITLAGFLCHPRCGGNHALVGWNQIGFNPIPALQPEETNDD